MSSDMKRSCESDENVVTKKLCAENKDEKDGETKNSSTCADDKDFLREKDVGITEFISDLPGFSGILKERYSDFLVNEIDLEGHIVHLTDLKEPTEITLVIDETDILLPDDLSKLAILSKSSEKCEPVIIDVTDKDKDTRRKIHQAIKKNFPTLNSTTECTDTTKTIVVQLGPSKRRNNHPTGRGDYTHFVMYKENKDSMDAINTISSILRLPSKNFSYAGTKDKRGKSSQLVSCYRAEASKLLGLNKKLNIIKIGNIAYKKTAIKLGDLKGNKFTIILRQVKGSSETIQEAMSSLSSRGFINYYGMQRFGTTSVATHHIGRFLLQGMWKEAIDLILQPRTGEDRRFAEARKVWQETQDASAALKKLQYKESIEGKLLAGLAKHSKDLVNALNCIPRNTRLIYIHSYQSYIWNKVLSRRINKYGLKVLPGDLTQTSNNLEGTEEIPTLKSMPKYIPDGDENQKDLIYDVVLPLPGHSVLYPNNEIKAWYEEFLKEDGMNLGNFISNVKSYSLSGNYRKIVVKPSKLKWEMIPYQDTTLPLVLSDWDVLQGVKLPDSSEGNSLQALKMEFSLPSSSYATMAVREVTKCDTCISAQKTLSTAAT